MMPESTFTPEALAEQISLILTQDQGATQMAHAALSLGKPDATEALMSLTLQLNEKNRT
jgi:UDP-N-acetylglucosamine--N-acetylmuramyl-(pentapeptide) pyrophosphoryl-undecaprenol N-acetylglucosamine transferase